tara:strand:- start:64 stop:606 length:543 start_codon:yes stop_codon:yes gene_type:complete
MKSLLLIGVLMLSGCQAPQVTSTETPKLNRYIDQIAALQWVQPKAWISQPISGFRFASYFPSQLTDQQVDISLSMLPYRKGRLLQNINRWRGQLNLGALSSLEEAQISIVTINDRRYTQVELLSQGPIAYPNEPTLMLVWITLLGENALYFKMVGPKGATQKQTSNMQSLISSIQWQDVK